MDGVRTSVVKLDELRSKHVCWLATVFTLLLAGFITAGALGPPLTVTTNPRDGTGAGMDMLTNCTVGADGKDLRAPVRFCWNHKFNFTQVWTQQFQLSMTVHREQLPAGGYSDVGGSLPVLVSWWGTKSWHKDDAWEEIVSEVISRDLRCDSTTPQCSQMSIFRTNSVTYKRYYFLVSLPSRESIPPTTLSHIDFQLRYRNGAFSIFEVGFKAAFFLISALATAMYLYLLKRARSRDKYRTRPAQGLIWVKVLLLSLLAFNNPFTVLQYYTPGATAQAFDSIFQLTFVSVLMFYWLVEFGLLAGYANVTATVPWRRFYIPRALAVFVYWLVTLTMYLWVIVKQSNDPLYDWAQDDGMLIAIAVFGVGSGMLYTVVLGFYCIKAGPALKGGRLADKALYVFHMVILMCVAGGLILGAVYGVDYEHAFDFLFYSALLNLYVIFLAYLYMPSENGPRVQTGRRVLSPFEPAPDSGTDDEADAESGGEGRVHALTRPRGAVRATDARGGWTTRAAPREGVRRDGSIRVELADVRPPSAAAGAAVVAIARAATEGGSPSSAGSASGDDAGAGGGGGASPRDGGDDSSLDSA